MRKNRIGIKFFSAFFCALLILGTLPCRSVAAKSTGLPSMEEATGVWFSHLESDILVASKAPELNIGAGSSVKVMSGLLFAEIFANRLQEQVLLEDPVWSAASPYFDHSAGGHRLGLVKGDIVSVEALLYAALCGSYNDAFYVLAVYSDGSVDAFLTRMDAKAAAIGMNSTEFKDVTGIYSGSRTTASDMAKLVTVAYQNALYMQVCSTVTYRFTSLKKPNLEFHNNNALICQYNETKYYQKYCMGMSAGSSNDGNCVLTVAKHNDETYICVVLGGTETDTDKFGYRIVNRLIDWVYDTYTYMEIVSPKTEICTIPVTVSDMTTEVAVHTDQTLSAYLPRTAEIGKDILYSIRLTNTTLEAPFEENTFVGYLAVIYDGRVLGTVKLYTSAGAERSSLIGALKSIQSLTKNRALVAGTLFFVLALVGWLVTESVLHRRRKHRWDKYFSNKMDSPDIILQSTKSDPNRLRKPNRK